ncbi:hypothetical protein L1987_60382 [Smallanthus sonchifolius]|uniref:Uncharacterized protein n=1 Tax=Smallanthus sonchifolius TaxID=185202 RepID=A0ACB9D7V1_9ASTR|nr:hypothetical protein L1987_60382 [Smallanthus sonchifolius]
MAEATRARVLEDTVKGVQDNQKAMRQDLDGVVSAIASLQQSITELIKRTDLNSGEYKKKSPVLQEGEGTSVLGRHKPAPVYLARFNGENPERWLAQASRYFEFYSISVKDQLTIASFYLDDTAADWFDWLQRHHQITTWDAFTIALLKRFRSSDLEEPEGLLAKLHQTSSVADYRSRFEAISNRTMPLPVEFLIRCWISGLRSDIKQSVICHEPTTLEDAMDKAQLHERTRPSCMNVGSNLSAVQAGLIWALLSPYYPLPSAKPLHNFFFYEDSPDPGGSPDSPSSEGTDSLLAEKLQIDEVKTQSAISYNAIESIASFSVLVGSGERLPCSGLARAVELVIQGQPIIVDFFVLPLHGWDMVLGVSWLAKLGPVITDYSTSVFEFLLHGKQVKWQGDTTMAQAIQFHGFRHLIHSDSIGQLFHLSLVPQDSNPPVYPADLEAVLTKFAAVFTAPLGLPPTRSQDHHIDLIPASNPVSVRPYRYPHFQKQEIERLVQEMLHQGIIRPSTSAFSSPVLLVRKKDGTWRFCVDFRALNSITIRDRFPIPSIEELFDELHDARYFSKLDLLAGYHQIRIAKGYAMKTAFRTHDGHYEFLVMPFGLTNAPSTFQRLMNDVFRPFLQRFILVFFDDILIYSKSWEDHLHHITLTLQLLLDNKLVAKLSKCIFGQSQVAYLGHVISSHGVAVDPEKISTIQQWPVPKNVKDVRSFLGLAGSTPILRLPDFSKPFIVETDASGTGIGAVLSQDKHPLAYFSKKLCPRMQQASTYHREMYAITQAISKGRQYLLGHKFTIITDQQSLKRLQDQDIQTPEQQKWLGKLLGFDFEIVYRPGTQNGAADALSRAPSDHLMALSAPVPSILQELALASQADPEFTTLLHRYTADPAAFPDYTVKDGFLLFKGRLLVPHNLPLRQQLLTEFHSSAFGGHSGVTRTYQRLSATFYWKQMRADVKDFISHCQICQQTKPSFLAPSGFLFPKLCLKILQWILSHVYQFPKLKQLLW